MMPMSPVMKPAIEQEAARKFRKRVDFSKPMTMEKGRRTPSSRRTKPMIISLRRLSILLLVEPAAHEVGRARL